MTRPRATKPPPTSKDEFQAAFERLNAVLKPFEREGISPRLKRRMQGKSCFNFRSVDAAELREVKRLTQRGFNRFRKEGLI